MFRLNNDQATALVWFVFGIIISIASLRYGLGVLSAPGAGFMPFLTGLAISLFSFIGLMNATFAQKQDIGRERIMRGLMWEKSLIVLGALFAYTLLLDILGFSLCTALFIGFILRTVKAQKWVVVFTGSMLIALSAYVLFMVLLEAQLPKGPWGF